MNFDINSIYLLSLFILIFMVSYGVPILYNRFNNTTYGDYLSLINILCYIRYYNYNKQLIVSDYESYHKYEIWKLYNQY
jgi:hypothetical protein